MDEIAELEHLAVELFGGGADWIPKIVDADVDGAAERVGKRHDRLADALVYLELEFDTVGFPQLHGDPRFYRYRR